MRSVFLLSLAVVLTSCQQDDEPVPNTNAPSGVSDALQIAGGLRITEMIEEGSDKTSYFEPYVFHFGEEGAVTATSDQQVVEGTYLIFQDDGLTELSMTFPSVGEFHELTDDWYFDSQDQSGIRFSDGADVLEFEFD
jgi:hypothetical protein